MSAIPGGQYERHILQIFGEIFEPIGALLDSVFVFPEFTDTCQFFFEISSVGLGFCNSNYLQYLVSILVSHGEIPTTFRSAGPCLKGSWPWSAPLDLRWGRTGKLRKTCFGDPSYLTYFFEGKLFKVQNSKELRLWNSGEFLGIWVRTNFCK